MATLIPKYTQVTTANRTIAEKFAESISVKDFGAVGDGVTDDYAAIMAAINSLPSTGGKIFFPVGVYLHNTKITVSKNVYFVGCGNSIVSSVTGPTELLKGASIAGNGLELAADGITIEHLNYRGAVGNTGDGIVFLGGRQTLRDVSVFTMGQDGIRIGRDGAGGNQNLWCLINIRSKNNGRNGLRIEDKISPLTASDCNAGTLLHADIQSNTGDGVYVGNTGLNTFVGLAAQSNSGYGVLLDANATYNAFFGGDFEANTLDELRLLAGATRNSFTGISVSGTAIDLGSNTSFVGCTGLGSPAGLIVPNVGDSNVKCLDWYEEGTFLPYFEGSTTTPTTAGSFTIGTAYKIVSVGSTDFTLIGASANTVGVIFTATGIGSGTGTASALGVYSTQAGNYTRIGNTVRISITLRTTSNTATGDCSVINLPFTSATSPKGRANLILNSQLLTYGAGIPFGYIADNSTSISLLLQSSNAAQTAIAIDTDAFVYISGTYQV